MKPIYSLVAAVLGGVAVGAALDSAVHAQPAEQPAYLVANVQEVHDQASLDEYRKEAPKTEALFGGQRVAGGMPQAIDGSELPKGQVVILRFPSMKALHDWWSSPAYAAVRPLREKATVGRLYVLPGAP